MNDIQIAQGVKVAGWVGIAAMSLWVVLRAWLDRGRKPEEIGENWTQP